MAEFSKQWCELYDTDMPHDFDIEEIADNISTDHYVPIICEGFGFISIGKDKNNEIILAYREGITDEEIVWKPYKKLIENGI